MTWPARRCCGSKYEEGFYARNDPDELGSVEMEWATVWVDGAPPKEGIARGSWTSPCADGVVLLCDGWCFGAAREAALHRTMGWSFGGPSYVGGCVARGW